MEPTSLSSSTPDTAELLVTHDAAPAAAPSAGQALISQAPLLIAIVAIFYFLIIRPQNQERKRHEQLLASLKKDDDVVTASGIYGRVTRVEDAKVELELAPKMRVWFEKAAIKGKAADAAADAKEA